MRETVACVFPADTRVSNPAAGFVLWLELPGKADALVTLVRIVARQA